MDPHSPLIAILALSPVFAWLILSIVVAYFAAHRKGRSFGGWFFLSLIMTPIISGILVLILPTNLEGLEAHKLETNKAKKCPFCSEIIKPDATVCRYCGRDLPETESKESA